MVALRAHARERSMIGEVAAWIRAADRITVLSGAGISTESGIPDYRGPNGVWTTNPASMRLVEIGAYLI